MRWIVCVCGCWLIVACAKPDATEPVEEPAFRPHDEPMPSYLAAILPTPISRQSPPDAVHHRLELTPVDFVACDPDGLVMLAQGSVIDLEQRRSRQWKSEPGFLLGSGFDREGRAYAVTMDAHYSETIDETMHVHTIDVSTGNVRRVWGATLPAGLGLARAWVFPQADVVVVTRLVHVWFFALATGAPIVDRQTPFPIDDAAVSRRGDHVALASMNGIVITDSRGTIQTEISAPYSTGPRDIWWSGSGDVMSSFNYLSNDPWDTRPIQLERFDVSKGQRTVTVGAPVTPDLFREPTGRAMLDAHGDVLGPLGDARHHFENRAFRFCSLDNRFLVSGNTILRELDRQTISIGLRDDTVVGHTDAESDAPLAEHRLVPHLLEKFLARPEIP